MIKNFFQKNSLLNELLIIFLSIFLFTFILPSGYIFNIPVQKYSFLSIVFLYMIYILSNWRNIFQIDNLKLILILGVSALSWMIFGYFNGYQGSTQVFNGLILPFLSFIIIVNLCKSDLIDVSNVLKIFFLILIIRIIGKIFIEILFLLGVFDIEQIVVFYQNVFNTEITTMSIQIGNYIFLRLMHAGDFFVVVLFSFYVYKYIHKLTLKIIIWMMTAIFVLIVYSRFIMGMFGVLSLFIIYDFFKALPKKYIYIICLIGFIVVVFLSPYIVDIIRQRFFSVDNANSDMIRDQQSLVLITSIKENLFVGHGLGAYINDFIRSDTNVFSYEKEYLSLLFQTGIIGFILIIANMLYIYVKSILQNIFHNSEERIFILLVLTNIVFFLIRPFFNPGLLGFNNGIIMIFLFISTFKNNIGKEEYNDFCSDGDL